MIIALSLAAILLCGVLMHASFLVRMYNEVMRIGQGHVSKAFQGFSSDLQPRLGFSPEDGQSRFALVQLVTLLFLCMDLMYISLFQAQMITALVETMIFAIAAIVVFADMLPALLAARTKGLWALRLVFISRLIGWLVQPLIMLGNFAASVAALGANSDGNEDEQNLDKEIDALLNAGQEKGLIDVEDRKLILSVVDYGDKTVREVMTARPQIVAIEARSTLQELRELMRQEDFSRIPVYSGTIDQMIGFVHSRKMLEYNKEELASIPVEQATQQIKLVPEVKLIQALMKEMQEAHAQMAIVIDEYGQTAGLVTVEDIMEEIVGEIRDESEPGQDVERQPDNSYIASGSLDLDLLEDLVGFRPDDEFESTTVGGLVCEQLGEVPAAGTKIKLEGLEVEVLASDARRVNRVQIRKRK